MSTQDAPTRAPAHRGPYAIAGVLIALAVVVPLIVPLYAFDAPRLAGIPFFYWYQLLWVFVDAGLLGIAYLVIRREDRRRRAALRHPDARPADRAPGGDA